jgi:hypothetical protein
MGTTAGPGPSAPAGQTAGGGQAVGSPVGGWAAPATGAHAGAPAVAPGGHPGAPPPPPPLSPPLGPGPAPGGAAGKATKPTRRRSSRSRKPGVAGFVADKAVPLLIAMLGLAAALATTYGAIVTSRANEAEATSTRLKRQVADLNDTNDSLTTDNSDLAGQIADLNDQVDELEGQLADGETTPTTVRDGNGTEQPSTGTSGPGQHAATILRQTGDTPVTFSDGYSIDLDSPAPDWGVRRSSGGDVYFFINGTTPRLTTPEMSVVDHVPTKAECDNATVLQPSLPAELTRVGTQVCTGTYDGHTAYVHIADINTDTGTITLDIIVWQ